MSTRSMMPMHGVFLIICSMIFLSLSEENISLMKPAIQNGVHTNEFGAHPASRAVDGCVNQTLSSGCCCHTAAGQLTTWWSVDLGQPSNIENITIFYREVNTNRFAGYKLYVSNGTQTVLCYEDTNGIADDAQHTVTHSCPYVATHVILFNHRSDPPRHAWYSSTAYIELCEMQVFGCPLGSFGNGNCFQTCSGCNGGICDPVTGRCLDGCITGRHGSSCENDCSATCSMNECNADSGHCLKCEPGYYGDHCDTNCKSICIDNTCDKRTGQCKAQKETINVPAVVVGATCGGVIAVLVILNIVLIKHLKLRSATTIAGK